MRRIDPQVGFATVFATPAMANAATPARVPVRRAPGLYRRAGWRLRQGLDTVRLWQERAHGRRQLRRFDDHLLRDIGITRLQAEAEADKPFWRA